MKASVYEKFGQAPTIQNLPDPTPATYGVVTKVQASGVYRSDYSGWKGHDPVIDLPHVPGHELEIVGSHGMQAHRYGVMMDMIQRGTLEPQRLIFEKIDLVASIDALVNFDQHNRAGMSVVTDFT